MANPEHLAKLREGVEAWNGWRKENPDITPDLRKTNLDRFRLEKVDLNGAQLEGAILNGAQLERANLDRAQLKGANLIGAQLEGASLIEAQLEGSRLGSANLSNANLRGCTGLHFDNTNILHASLTSRPGKFFNGLLPWFIYNPVTDPWSELRRAYTGPNFLLTLLALITFMLP